MLQRALALAAVFTVPGPLLGAPAPPPPGAASSRPAAAIPVPDLRVVAEGCFAHDRFVSELTAKLLRRKRLGLPGTLALWCTSSRVDSNAETGWELVEVDAELRHRSGEVTRRWRSAAMMRSRPNRPTRPKDAPELAANSIALTISKDPKGQPPVRPPRFDDEGRRHLSIALQVSNEIGGGCDYARSFLKQILHTQVVGDFISFDLVSCRPTGESNFGSYGRAADSATRVLDTQTDLVVQLSTREMWGNGAESVVGVATILGRLPFIILKATQPVRPEFISRVFGHELGHLVGIPHVDALDLMHPVYSKKSFVSTRDLFRAGLARWFVRPWRGQQHYFDDGCLYLYDWWKLKMSGIAYERGPRAFAVADILSHPTSGDLRICINGLYEQACDDGWPSACVSHGELSEYAYDDPMAAMTYYQRACEADSATGCLHSARLLLERGEEPELALTFAAKANGLRRRASPIHVAELTAWAAVELGQREEAVQLLLKALEKFPTSQLLQRRLRETMGYGPPGPAGR